MRIIDKNINEQKKALYRKEGGGNIWRELGEKGKQQKLTDAQILELSELILKIENHYGTPQDIEWAWEKEKFYIIQSRPITTLRKDTSLNTSEEIKKTPWILKWESRHPYYRMEFYFRGEKEGFAYGSDNKKLLGISRNNVMQCYYYEDDQKRIRENSLNILLNKKKVKQYFEETEKTVHTLFALLAKKVDTLDKNGLQDFYKKIVLEYQKLYTSYDLSRPEYFETVEKRLKQALSDEDFITATTPTKQTTLDRESFEFLSIVASQSKDKIVRHQKKYGWIGASEDDHPWSVDFYTQKFHSMTSKQAKAELDAKKKKLALLQKKQKQIDSRANTETRYLCDVVKKMAHLRLESRLNWARADRAVNNILSFIASHFHVPADDIFYYSENDILRLIDGHKLDASVLAKRKEAFAFRYDQQTFFEYSGEREVRTLEKNENVALEEIGADSITGSVANNGYARGRVKVISAHTKDQQAASELMEEGDILVTGMTRPHLIYAIKKASAIVTDEGGIACHAAIVSRELNKPCIIGTKIATKILHDGDLVEVDADKGVVRIVKKAA